jgi:hypothetical protein
MILREARFRANGGGFMRSACLAALIGWLVLAATAAAQSNLGDALVRIPAAEVRGGKSTIFPVTGSLRQGMPVKILREEDGWLAITPPTGSSSWIQDRQVKHYPARNGQRAYLVVLGDNVPVHLGTPANPRPHEILTGNLNRGSILFPIGAKITYKQTEWWRIEPASGEVRYVSREAVTLPNTSVVSASTTPNAGAPTSNNPLWVKAEQAERSGNFAQAELCYRQLVGEMAGPGGDHDLAIRCQNRIEALWRAGKTQTWAARQPAPGVLLNNPSTPGTPVPLQGAQSPNVATGPGWLRRTSVVIDNRPAFALEDNQGQLRYYLVAQTGLDLTAFLNRTVEVFGPFLSRGDLAGGGYISVGCLHLLR